MADADLMEAHRATPVPRLAIEPHQWSPGRLRSFAKTSQSGTQLSSPSKTQPGLQTRACASSDHALCPRLGHYRVAYGEFENFWCTCPCHGRAPDQLPTAQEAKVMTERWIAEKFTKPSFQAIALAIWVSGAAQPRSPKV